MQGDFMNRIPNLTLWFAHIYAFALIALAIGGCTTTMQYGEPVKYKMLENLTPGKSSIDEVKSVLGAPRGQGAARFSAKMDVNTVWYYEYIHSDMKQVKSQILMVYFYQNIYEGHMWFSAAELVEFTERKN